MHSGEGLVVVFILEGVSLYAAKIFLRGRAPLTRKVLVCRPKGKVLRRLVYVRLVL